MDLAIPLLPLAEPLLPTLYLAKQRAAALVLGVMGTAWHMVLSPGKEKNLAALRALEALHEEALRTDRANAEAGLYPWSLVMPLPGWHDVRYLPEALADSPAILWRKRKGEWRVEAKGAEDLPGYYRRTFHWQTGGWMSAHSARIYELQVEVLFFGTMDVMRRRALAPLVRALGKGTEARVLDVACGTGRFLEQVRAAMPRALLEGIDLSPYYAARARRRLEAGQAAVRVANAEAIGGPDGAYDAVTCGFLFHELPSDARKKVAAELARVVKSGGLVVVQDSAQRLDPNGKALEVFLDWFPTAYHEPYYKGYSGADLGALLEEAGLVVESVDYALFSKVVVARKP